MWNAGSRIHLSCVLADLLICVCLSSQLQAAPAAEDQGIVTVQDNLQALPPGSVRLSGFFDDTIRQQQAGDSFDPKTLAEMANVYRLRPNGFAVGEFWGKTVRALCHHVQYSGDPRLMQVLRDTVEDLISTQSPDGCISPYEPARQPFNTDLWDRKYALLGLLNSYETTHDPKTLQAAIRMADHLMTQVGPGTKTRVIDTFYITGPPQIPGGFQGIESSSILEPMMRLYRWTGSKRYLEFARNIVEVEGGSRRGNIFQAVLKGKDVKDLGGDGDPDHAVAHAYNIISCFEGLLEYYRVTGAPVWKQSALAVYTNVLAKELTVIGAPAGLGGVNNGLAPTEQFNYAAMYQTCPVREGLEGCTHARWMAFCRHLLMLTGDPAFGDQFELTMYNGFLGSIRPDGRLVDYHTHLNGVRPAPMNYQQTFNGRSITCCFYNVVDTLALIPFTTVMKDSKGVRVNLYIPGTSRVDLPGHNAATLEQTTEYPRTGSVQIKVQPLKPARFPISLRIPQWSRNTTVLVNGKKQAARPGSYLTIERKWSMNDKIVLELDMRARLVRSPEGSPKSAEGFRALVRGPLVLARDKRLGGDIYQPVDIAANREGEVELQPMTPAFPALIQCMVPTVQGGSFPVIDFATSGNTWDARSERVTWIPRSSAQ